MIAIPAPTLAPVASLPSLRHPALRALFGRWRAHCGLNPLPCEADLPFLNLKPWLGRVRRVAVADGGRSFALLPCAQARVEPQGERLQAAYRRAVFDASPVRVVPGPGMEALVLPFAARPRGTGLLLVALYDGVPAG